MTEAADPAASPPPAGPSAGSLLRQARQAQGLHIAALAAAIKVTQRKLEALEADRFDELPDATFTRALAQTVCRTLKIDAAPVLALLPKPAGHRLEHVGEGINAPFRDRPGSAPAGDWSLLASPALWAPLLLIVAAAVVYFLPPGWIALPKPTPAASSATVVVPVEAPASALAAPVPVSASAVPAVASAASGGVAAAAPPVVTAPMQVTAAAPSASSGELAVSDAVPSAGVLQLRTTADSWIEVVDARGQTLLSRLVPGGETVGLDGVAPLKLTIGNAGATQVVFRGRSVDLASHTMRDNVARLTLK